MIVAKQAGRETMKALLAAIGVMACVGTARAGIITQEIPIFAASDGYDGAWQNIHLALPSDAAGDIHLSFSGLLSSGFDPEVYTFHEFIAIDANLFGSTSPPIYMQVFDGAFEQSASFETNIPLLSDFRVLAWTQSDIGAANLLANDYTVLVGTLNADIDPPDSVPEPASLSLLAIGLAGVAWSTKRKGR